MIEFHDNFNFLGNQFICTKECPCASVEPSFWQPNTLRLQNKYFNGTNLNIELCVKYYTELFDINTLEIIKSLESENACGGICTLTDFFIYGDVRQ